MTGRWVCFATAATLLLYLAAFLRAQDEEYKPSPDERIAQLERDLADAHAQTKLVEEDVTRLRTNLAAVDRHAALGWELFHGKHLRDTLTEWTRTAGALRDISSEPDFAFNERKPVPGTRWYVLRLEPRGDPTGAGMQYVKFHLDPADNRRFERLSDYVIRATSLAGQVFFRQCAAALEVEDDENERRRPTDRAAEHDVRDALLHGTTRLYRLPSSETDCEKSLALALRIF